MILEGHTVRAIPNHPGYYATKCGLIVSTKRSTPQILTSFDNGKGYHKVKLSNKGKATNHRRSKLVAIAWLGKPGTLETVDHINEVRDDDHVNNLRWMHIADNIRR